MIRAEIMPQAPFKPTVSAASTMPTTSLSASAWAAASDSTATSPTRSRGLQVAPAQPAETGRLHVVYSAIASGDIKQYALAMSHYEKAIQDIPDRDQDNKKRAYFKAGYLALRLKDLVKADKYPHDVGEHGLPPTRRFPRAFWSI